MCRYERRTAAAEVTVRAWFAILNGSASCAQREQGCVCEVGFGPLVAANVAKCGSPSSPRASGQGRFRYLRLSDAQERDRICDFLTVCEFDLFGRNVRFVGIRYGDPIQRCGLNNEVIPLCEAIQPTYRLG